jgi:hypothetical protein
VRLHELFVIHLSGEEIKERSVGGFSIESTKRALLSLFFFLLLLVNLVVSVEEAESEDDESNEEVNDLESDFALSLELFPVSSAHWGLLNREGNFLGYNSINWLNNNWNSSRGFFRGISPDFRNRSSFLNTPAKDGLSLIVNSLAADLNVSGLGVKSNVDFVEIVCPFFWRNIFPELLDSFLSLQIVEKALQFLCDGQILKFVSVFCDCCFDSLLDLGIDLGLNRWLNIGDDLLLNSCCVKLGGQIRGSGSLS